MKYIVGDKVLIKVPGRDIQVASILHPDDAHFSDYGDYSVRNNKIWLNIKDAEILRKISDKPLCNYGKLLW